MFCFHNSFFLKKESKLILVNCPRQMAWEAPAWKRSDITALSAVTQTHWALSSVIRNPGTPQGTLPWASQEHLCHSFLKQLFNLQTAQRAEGGGQHPEEGGQVPGSKTSSCPGRSPQGQLTMLPVARLSFRVVALQGSVVYLGLRYLRSCTAGPRICPSIDKLTSPSSSTCGGSEELLKSFAQCVCFGFPSAVFFGLFPPIMMHFHCYVIKYRSLYSVPCALV